MAGSFCISGTSRVRGTNKSVGGLDRPIGQFPGASVQQGLDPEPLAGAHDMTQKRGLAPVPALDADRARHDPVQAVGLIVSPVHNGSRPYLHCHRLADHKRPE